MNYFLNSTSFQYTSRQFVKNNTSDFLGAQLFVRGNSKLFKVYTDLAAQRDDGFSLGLEIINTYISLYEDTLKQFHTSGVDFMIINKIEFHLNKIKGLYAPWFQTSRILFEKDFINKSLHNNIPLNIWQIWERFDYEYTSMLANCTILYYICDREYKKLIKDHCGILKFYEFK